MYKKPLLKLALAGAVLLFSQSIFAQFKFSKINVADGVKTALKAGDKIDVYINENGTVKQNVVVEIDIAACRNAYKYDIITVGYVKNGYLLHRQDHEFESMLNSKKYGNKGTIPVYAFDNKKFKETDFRVLATDKVEYEGEDIVRKIAVYGQYITGEEGYFDRNDRYQWRNKVSELELLGYVDLIAHYPTEQINAYNVAAKAKRYASDQYDVTRNDDYFKRDVLSKIEASRAPVVDTPILAALSNGYKEVWNWKLKEVKQYDSKETSEMFSTKVTELYEMYKIMYESVSDKERLKSMNKEIKSHTTVEQKWMYIKSL